LLIDLINDIALLSVLLADERCYSVVVDFAKVQDLDYTSVMVCYVTLAASFLILSCVQYRNERNV